MKAEFSNTETLLEWLKNVVNATKYDLYYETVDRNLYAIKNVSTEPRLHGYVTNVDVDDAHDVGDAISTPVTNVKSWEWEHEGTEATNV